VFKLTGLGEPPKLILRRTSAGGDPTAITYEGAACDAQWEEWEATVRTPLQARNN
jgi:hypothetical protein